MMEPRRLDHEEPITIADAPALCPTCRMECYADESTGEVLLTRLYFASEDRMENSSIVGSSPMRPVVKTSRVASEQLMSLARRAKTMGDETKGFHSDISESVVTTMLSRADALKTDAASAKAIQAVKVSYMCLDSR